MHGMCANPAPPHGNVQVAFTEAVRSTCQAGTGQPLTSVALITVSAVRRAKEAVSNGKPRPPALPIEVVA